jgi:spermidine synthase
MPDNWFLEKHTPHAGLTLAYRRRLHDEQTPFQRIEVFETQEYGKLLTLDGYVMLTDRDEFVYHEMITHVPLFAHGAPRDVLIIGGGDGGTLRECLKHEQVQQVTLVEIDGRVMDVSRQYFPQVAVALDDPRARVLVDDGFEHLRGRENSYDVVLCDSIDPVGEAAKLFTAEFYGLVHRALRPGGVATFQSESPFYSSKVLREVVQDLSSIFRHVAPYLAAIPTYPSGLWSFTFASDRVDPRLVVPPTDAPLLAGLQYYTPPLFQAAFTLPRYVERAIAGE